MTNISNNYSVHFGQKSERKTEQTQKETETKELSKTKQVLLGAAAVASIMTGIVLLRGKISKKAVEETGEQIIKNAKESIQAVQKKMEELTQDEKYKKIFDVEKTQKHIEDALALPEQEQEARMQIIEETLNDTRGLKKGIQYGKEKFISTLPKEIQEAIAEKDHVKAHSLYAEYGDDLFHKSKTAGKTPAQSVLKTFGEKTTVQAHKYDLTKEADEIVTMQHNQGNGFISINVNSENMIPDRTINFKHRKDYSPYVKYSEPNTINVYEGVHEGKKYVTINYPSYEILSNNDAVPNAITILSPNKNLTPAQQDLLKIKDLNEEELKLFKDLTITGKENSTNFDSILSVISTVAGRR